MSNTFKEKIELLDQNFILNMELLTSDIIPEVDEDIIEEEEEISTDVIKQSDLEDWMTFTEIGKEMKRCIDEIGDFWQDNHRKRISQDLNSTLLKMGFTFVWDALTGKLPKKNENTPDLIESSDKVLKNEDGIIEASEYFKKFQKDFDELYMKIDNSYSKSDLDLIFTMSILSIYSYLEEYISQVETLIVKEKFTINQVDESMDFVRKNARSGLDAKIRNIFKEIGYYGKIRDIIGKGNFNEKMKIIDKFRSDRNIMAHTAMNFDSDQYQKHKKRLFNKIIQLAKNDNKNEVLAGILVNTMIIMTCPATYFTLIRLQIMQIISLLDASIDDWLNQNSISDLTN